MKRISFKTFGCRANNTDTDNLIIDAGQRGWSIVRDNEKADAYIVNSCTVTSLADRDARLSALKLKRKNPDALVGVVGCYSQVNSEELLQFPEIDFVLGTADKNKILSLIQDKWSGKEVERNQVTAPSGYLPEKFLGSRFARANIKIQDGCNYKCTFCIIPTARGRSRSLPLETVISQIRDAEKQGFMEAVLTGIHLAHYGWDQGTDLSTLLHEIFKQTQSIRIRLSTLDPFEIPEGLLDLLKNEERLCPYFHIALQSGSDAILKKMKRLYVAQEFNEITHKIIAVRKETFIGVDVIVGFPSEGEVEFAETLKCLSVTPWSKLHVFSYSERKDTKAQEIYPKVTKAVIQARSEQLRKLSDDRYFSYLDSQLFRPMNVLVEQKSTKNPGFWLGHSENYVPVLFKSETSPLRKQVVPVIPNVRLGDKLLVQPTSISRY